MVKHRPLIVDLDGTLLRSDMLVESMLGYVRHGIRDLHRLPVWVLKGKAALKEHLACQVPLQVDRLPYNQAVLAFLREEKKHRPIILATATHQIYAEKIAAHIGLFDRVIATGNRENLSARTKRDRLVQEFGEKGFDYLGNSMADIPVWQSAEKAYVADPEPGVLKKARQHGNVEKVFATKSPLGAVLLKSLRPHQWLKNLLIFIPLLARHEFTNFGMMLSALLAFVLFSLTASSGYLVNDLFDLECDRHHERKRYRPLASGELPLLVGIAVAFFLALFAFIFSLLVLPSGFSVALGLYFLLTVSYSQYFKRIAVVDTITLAGLYTLRIIAGALACGLAPTFWILAFSMFFFLSLAMVKRYAELLDSKNKGKSSDIKGRGYFTGDLEVVANLGTAAGYLSVLVLALYIQDDRTVRMYALPELIWLACPILLFWISHIWMITHQGKMHDDPVLFAVKDRVSLISGGLFALVFILAIFL
jgi:4-hydroxybenzoate polyprenyltransferase